LATKVGSGSTPKGGDAVYTSIGHYFVRSQNVGMGFLMLDNIAHINDDIHQKHKATEIYENDVLLNITGASIGRTAVATKELEGGNVNQHVCIIRTNSKVNPKFLCDYIQTQRIQNHIKSLQTGGSREGLNFEQIRSFPISLPSINEQNKLTCLLDKINERIATQVRLIEDLKKLRCAIVEKMFKQSKANGRLGDFIEQVSVRNKNGLYSNVLSVSNKQGFVKQSEQFEDRTVASEDTSNYKIVKRNNFAYNPARINVGSIARLTKFDVGIVSPMYVCFRTKASIIPEYMEAFFTSQQFFYEMMKRLEGSVRLCLSYEGLCNIPVYITDMNKQIAMGQNISLILSKIGLEIEYLGRLHQQKQYLLRKMFI
jgi:type I restriction enzyme S subunit